jgi:hypothetical protein
MSSTPAVGTEVTYTQINETSSFAPTVNHQSANLVLHCTSVTDIQYFSGFWILTGNKVAKVAPKTEPYLVNDTVLVHLIA